MAKIPAIYARYSDNVLTGAVITSTVAPLSTYFLTTLATLQPGARVLFGVKTVTITFTISSAQGDILVIPAHNFDPGTGVVSITNGAGYSQGLTIPALQANGLPPTLVVDLSALSGTRTTTVWNLVIASNSVNVCLGGFVAIYGPKRSFLTILHGDNFAMEYEELETPNGIKTTNEYGTIYVQDYETTSRQIRVTLRCTAAGLIAIKDWFRANRGMVRPSLFWPDPNVVDAYVGTWPATLDVQHVFGGLHVVVLTFDEWPKGKPF